MRVLLVLVFLVLCAGAGLDETVGHMQYDPAQIDALAQLLTAKGRSDDLRPGLYSRFVRDWKENVPVPSTAPPSMQDLHYLASQQQLQERGPTPGAMGRMIDPLHGVHVVSNTAGSGGDVSSFSVSSSSGSVSSNANSGSFSASSSSGAGVKHNTALPKPLRVSPTELTFGERPTCIAHVEAVNFVNVGEAAVDFTSVTVDSINYHHTFSKPVSLGVRKNLTLNIVFLPTVADDLPSWLYVQTSVGSFSYKLLGKGIPNGYGVESFLNLKIPPQVLFSPPITLVNPHNEVLRVEEVFSIGQAFQFMLGDGRYAVPMASPSEDKSSAPWDLLPQQAKSLLQLAFITNKPGRHSGYVCVRTNKGLLLLRVDLLVSPGGIYVTSQKLEFHTLTNVRQKRRLRVRMINSGPAPVTLLGMRVDESESLIKCNFKPGQVIPISQEQTVGEVEFRGTREGEFSGRVIVETNSPVDSILFVPYHARVLHGALKFSVVNTTFFTPGVAALNRGGSGGGPVLDNSFLEMLMAAETNDATAGDRPAGGGSGELVITQSQELTNSFRVPVTLYTAAVDDARFSVLNFQPGITIAPNSTYNGLLIQYRGPPDASIARLRLSMQSNVAKEFLVPLWTFHGRLAVSKTDSNVWSKFSSLMPAFTSDPAVRTLITKETPVCEANCLTPKYTQGMPSVTELAHLFSLFFAGRTYDVKTIGEKDIMPVLTSDSDEMVSLNQTTLDLGTLSLGEVRRVRLNVTNLNPRDVRIMRFGTSIPSISVEFGFVHNPAANNVIVLDMGSSTSGVDSRQGWWVRQHHSAIFTLIVAAEAEGKRTGKIVMETLFEVREWTVTYEVVAGDLQLTPSKINFGTLFPGGTRSAMVFGLSTFRRPLTVLSVRSNDDRVVPVLRNHTLYADVNTTLATLLFEPGRLEPSAENSKREWSSATSSSSSSSLASQGSPQYIPLDALKQLAAFGISRKEVDSFNQNEFLWGRLRSSGRDYVNATVTFHTSIVSGYEMLVTGHIKQPSLTAIRELVFPLTQYGTVSDRFVTVVNPSDASVELDGAAFYVTDWQANEDFRDDESARQTAERGGLCSFDLDAMVAQRDGKTLAKSPILIPPHGQIRFGPISFRPRGHPGTHTAVMLLRNNLTHFQPVHLVGEGGTAVLRFLDDRSRAIPHSIVLNETIDPRLYRMPSFSNYGPPIRSSVASVDSEGKGSPVVFHLTDDAAKKCLRRGGGGGGGGVSSEEGDADTDADAEDEEDADDEHSSSRSSHHHHVHLHHDEPIKLNFSHTVCLLNFGSLPMIVHRVFVGNSPCSFRGFSVHPCYEGFVLDPWNFENFTIEYVPDFTASREKETVHFYTSVGVVSMSVEAVIPTSVLSVCHNASPEVSGSWAMWFSVLRIVLLIASLSVALWVFIVVASSSTGSGGAGSGGGNVKESSKPMSKEELLLKLAEFSGGSSSSPLSSPSSEGSAVSFAPSMSLSVSAEHPASAIAKQSSAKLSLQQKLHRSADDASATTNLLRTSLAGDMSSFSETGSSGSSSQSNSNLSSGNVSAGEEVSPKRNSEKGAPASAATNVRTSPKESSTSTSTTTAPAPAPSKKGKGVRQRSGSEQGTETPVVKESVSIPPKLPKRQSDKITRDRNTNRSPTQTTSPLLRASSESLGESEESSDDVAVAAPSATTTSVAEKAMCFWLRVDCVLDALDRDRISSRAAESLVLDARSRVQVVQVGTAAAGGVIFECHVNEASGNEKMRTKVKRFFKISNKAALSSVFGANVLESSATALRPGSPLKSMMAAAPASFPATAPAQALISDEAKRLVPTAKKETKKATSVARPKPAAAAASTATSSGHAHHQRSAASGGAAAPGRPSQGAPGFAPTSYASAASGAHASSPTAKQAKFVGGAVPGAAAVGTTPFVGGHIASSPGSSAPPPPVIGIPSNVHLTQPVAQKPKRTFQPVNLFTEDMHRAAIQAAPVQPPPPVGAQQANASVQFQPAGPSAGVVGGGNVGFLGVPSSADDLETVSPPPGMGQSTQGLLPRDLLTSSGGSFFGPGTSPRQVDPSNPVHVRSFFGDWALQDTTTSPSAMGTSPASPMDFGASLMSELHAPRQQRQVPHATDEQMLFSTHLAWMGDAAAGGGDPLLLDVALEDDASLLEAPLFNNLFPSPPPTQPQSISPRPIGDNNNNNNNNVIGPSDQHQQQGTVNGLTSSGRSLFL